MTEKRYRVRAGLKSCEEWECCPPKLLCLFFILLSDTNFHTYNMYNKIIASFLILNFFLLIPAKADEGMWLPLLLKQLNESDMQRNGLKLSAEDIYSINKSSLKDAIVQFNGGCTAEIISDRGLILTNHHCGFGQIQAHSTVENDLLKNGFWAMNEKEELVNEGVTATLIVRMEDVTSKVWLDVKEGMTDAERDKKIAEASLAIQKEAVVNTHYGAFVRPFFYGNEYYLFITETFKDVRLVGAPPEAIGKFGGETDNWVWPRHNADFSLFRIYANKNNEPADYSPDNVPYKPKYVIPISLKGEEKDDFTMVYGFPGRTTEYLTSYAVDMIMNIGDPEKVKLRDIRLKIMQDGMKTNEATRLQYAAKSAGLANAYKKWKGEIMGLKKGDAMNKKKSFEKDFLEKAQASNTNYAGVLIDIEGKYIDYTSLTKQRDYYAEGIMGIEALTYSMSFIELFDSLNKGKSGSDVKKIIDKLKNNAKGFYKDYNAQIDEKLCAALLKVYSEDVDKTQQPEIFNEITKKYKNDFEKYARDIYSKSFFVSESKMNEALRKVGKNYKKLQKDPMYELMLSCVSKYNTDVRGQYAKMDAEINNLNRLYMKGIRELNTNKKYYPDANSTLRVAYGKVEGYYPRDGVMYNYFTTLDGVMEKEIPNDAEFNVPPKLKELRNKKDYGRYADKDGKLHVAFCASNHTTGGNSGSPVFNGKGELIGTNFDRDWEGTMSDILYDPNQVRNIILDVRYTLFVIDKYAGAGYLVNEMKMAQ